MIRSFRYRLYPSKSQANKIKSFFNYTAFLYNCALEHRIVMWNQWGKHTNYYDQARSITELRKIDSGVSLLNYSVCQETLKRLDRAFNKFYKGIRDKSKVGFPRFKGENSVSSITFPTYGDGIKLIDKKLYIQNIGNISVRLHRSITGSIKTVCIKRAGGKYYASFLCDNVEKRVFRKTKLQVGIDVGIKKFAALSNGQTIKNPKHFNKKLKEIKLAASKFHKNKTTKNRTKLSKLYSKVYNQRKDFLHKTSLSIVKKFGYIFIEDINFKNILYGNTKVLKREISAAAWGTFFDMLFYKAEEAGRVIAKVNPCNTTKICSACGAIVEKTLSERKHICKCGYTEDGDINAAINILRIGQGLCFKQEAA